MADVFVVKNWENFPSTATPISAEALKDLETRLSDWAVQQREVEASFSHAPEGLEGIGHKVIRRMENDLGDVTVLHLGDSTSAEVVMNTPWPRRLAQWFGESYDNYTVLYYLWNETDHDYNAPETLHEGSEDGYTLHYYNGAASGERTHYHFEWLDTIVNQKQPDLCFISHGHNQAAILDIEHIRSDIMILAQAVQRACGTCEVVVCIQNPRFYHYQEGDEIPEEKPEGARYKAQDEYNYKIAELVEQSGYGLLDFWTAYNDEYDGDIELMKEHLDDAHLHPDEEGQQLQTDTATNRLNVALFTIPRFQPPPSLIVPVRSWCTDGRLENWDTASGTIADESGNGHEGTPTNGIIIGDNAATKYAGQKSTQFTSASSHYIVTGSSAAAFVAPFAMCATVYRDNNAATHAVFGGSDSDGPILQYASGNNNITFDPQLLAGSSVTFTGAGAVTTWQSLFLYYNGVNVYLYINGSLVSSPALADAFSATPGNIMTGQRGNNTTYWNGKMQHIAFFPNFTGSHSAAAAAISTDPETILDYDPYVYYGLNTEVASGDTLSDWVHSNVVSSKDTVNWNNPQGFSAKLEPAVVGGGSSYISQLLDADEIRPLLGGWASLTHSHRVNLDEANQGFAGRVQITTIGGAQETPGGKVSNSVQTGKECWKYAHITRYLPTDIDGVRIFCIANRNSNDDASISVDQIAFTEGKMMRSSLA